MQVIYRYEDWTIAGIMNDVSGGLDRCIVISQRYMSQFPSIVAACIIGDGAETVVSKATEWQKRNG